MSKKAVIDLGTNTFHLLVVEMQQEQAFRAVFRERIFVHLAEDGIETIGAAPFARGLAAMEKFKLKLEELAVHKVRAFGTAALRTAANGGEFVRQVYEKTGIEVELIDGLEEARLIHLGVKQAVPFDHQKQLVMDIGGGSVEFVVANADRVFWSQSYLAGVSVLFHRFHHSDPIQPAEIQAVENYLAETLASLFEALKQYPCHILTGASGAFDTVTALMPHQQITPVYAILEMEFFPELYRKIIASTIAERQAMPDIPDERIKMIVVAMVLIDFILRQSGIRHVNVSAYAMKEGMLVDG